MASAFRFVADKWTKYSAPKSKSRTERFKPKGSSSVETQQPVNNIQAFQKPQHPEDKHLFNEEDHGLLPMRRPPDDLGPSPVIPPEVSRSGCLVDYYLASLDGIPGVEDINVLIEKVCDQIATDRDSKVVHLGGDQVVVTSNPHPHQPYKGYIDKLKSDCATLLEHVKELNPTSPQFNKTIKDMRMELMNILVHLKYRTSEDRVVELQHRCAIIQRLIRCRQAYDLLVREFQAIQGGEILHEVRQTSQQTKSHNAELEGQIQAAEDEVQRILRRERGSDVPREIILKREIKYQEFPALPAVIEGRYTVHKGEMMSGDKIAIKFFLQPELDFHRERGRRILRHASLWSSFDSKYILPFLGMGVEMIERKLIYGDSEDRSSHRVYLVTPWIPDGNAVIYIREAHKQQSFVDVAKIVCDMALGLKYLHERSEPCIHGSLRGENVLIKMEKGVEQACLNGFALRKKQKRTDPVIDLTGVEDHTVRWQAPEAHHYSRSLDTSSDVWSWAMTALELYSGKEPYHQHYRGWTILQEISEGGLPSRELYPDFDKYAPEPDETWALLEKCWKMDPKERPTIIEVLAEIDRIGAMPKASAN